MFLICVSMLLTIPLDIIFDGDCVCVTIFVFADKRGLNCGSGDLKSGYVGGKPGRVILHLDVMS